MWSFGNSYRINDLLGVLIIEILTNKTPWKEFSPMEVIQMVAYEGRHLEIPSGTHPSIQQVLEERNFITIH